MTKQGNTPYSPLMQCIKRERELVAARFLDCCAYKYCKVCAPLRAARAVTDEAVRMTEAEINSLRQQNWATQPSALTHEHLRFLRILDDVNRLDDDDHEKLRAIANILAASLTSKEEQ